MDSGEAVVRVVRRLGIFIVAGGLLGLLGGLWLQRGEVPTFTAEARIVLDLQGPRSTTEARGLADQATALASSASIVAAAADDAGVSAASADDFEVGANALGSSGVIRLSVTGSSPEGAARFADSLAGELVTRWSTYTRSGLLEAIRVAEERGDQVRQELVRAEELLLASVAGGDEAEIQAQTLRRNDLRDELADLRSDWAELTASMATRPLVEVLDRPVAPDAPDPSGAPLEVLLATFAGLALGVCVATLRELWNPKVVGPRAVARAVDLPLLATISRPRPWWTPTQAEIANLVAALRLVRGPGARAPVTFLDAGSGIDLASLEQAVTWSLTSANGHSPTLVADGVAVAGVYGVMPRQGQGAVPGAEATRQPVDPGSADLLTAQPGPPRAPRSPEPSSAVLVAPAVASRSALEDTRRLANTAGRRLLGVVVVTPRPVWARPSDTLDDLDGFDELDGLDGLDLFREGRP